jgi:D-arabinose 1-dehydrogenase-like Zn-dependent alcohol dehydrogenase
MGESRHSSPADNYVQLPILEPVLNGITVVGSIVGTRKDLADVFHLHALGRTRVIRESRRLDEGQRVLRAGPQGTRGDHGPGSHAGRRRHRGQVR